MGIGAFRHRVMFQAPGPPVPDGEGGFTDGWVDLPPAWDVEIKPATIRDMERLATGTVVAAATHVIRGRYRGDVKKDARLIFDAREFRITGVKNVDERGAELHLFAIETI